MVVRELRTDEIDNIFLLLDLTITTILEISDNYCQRNYNLAGTGLDVFQSS